MDDSKVIHHASGTTFVGPDAISCMRAFALASALDLYAKAGILPSRNMSATKLLRAANQYTGKTYRYGEHAQAAADVRLWAREMRDALPTVNEGE